MRVRVGVGLATQTRTSENHCSPALLLGYFLGPGPNDPHSCKYRVIWEKEPFDGFLALLLWGWMMGLWRDLGWVGLLNTV